MSTRKSTEQFSVVDALIGAFATNNRINCYLIENLPEQAWRAAPPGNKGRDVGSIAAHMHNVRLMWLKAIGAAKLPDKLDPKSVTKAAAAKALDASCRALEEVLRAALSGDGRIKGFKPDVAGFFSYLVAHDAHHRGQMSMLARQAGHPVPQSVMFGMWEWGTR